MNAIERLRAGRQYRTRPLPYPAGMSVVFDNEGYDDAVAAVEALYQAAKDMDAVMHEQMPEWYGDPEWPQADALAAAVRRVEGD